MSWTKDGEEAFPPRHPREPGGLRQDILDEIADHLACAAEREQERGGEKENEEAAWGRVLERFGNPNAVARRLWWDHMRETVMREWIQTGVMVVLSLAAVVFMALVLRQMTTANQAVLEALRSNATVVNPLVALKVQVKRGSEEGPPAEGVEVQAVGNAFGDSSAYMTRPTDASGTAIFGPMQPGQFEVFATDIESDMRFESKRVTLFAGQDPERVQIVAPDIEPREVSLEFSSPLPQGEGRVLHAAIETLWQRNGANWTGHEVAIADNAGVRSYDWSVISPAGPAGAQDGAIWNDLVTFNAPLKLSGDPVSIQLSLLNRAVYESMASRTAGAPWIIQSAVLRGADFAPLPDGKGYRIELPPAFLQQFADWRIQDHAEARGIVLEERLWNALRAAYPDYLVDRAERVEASKGGLLSGNLLYRPEGPPELDEMLSASSMRRFVRENGGLDVDFRDISILQTPPAEDFPVAAGSHVILALFVTRSNLSEFENKFQAWPVLNNVLDTDWPVLTPEPSHDLLAAELGAAPIAEQTNEVVLNAVNANQWLLFDATTAFSSDAGGILPEGLMLRWSREEFGFKNEIRVVAAGAKQVENESLRPLWLLLAPMDTSAEQATKQ